MIEPDRKSAAGTRLRRLAEFDLRSVSALFTLLSKITMRLSWKSTVAPAICWLCSALLLTSSREAAAQRQTDKFPDSSEINLAIREDRFADMVELTTAALRGKESSHTAAQLHLARAKGEAGLHDLKDCRADVEEAIKLDPAIKNAYATRAWFEEVDGKWAAAAADRTVAMSETNAAPDHLPARAYDYAQAGKKALARRDYEEIALRPAKTAEDYTVQGGAFHALGQEERAARAYATAKRLRPSDASVLNSVAWFEVTSTVAKYRNGQAALQDATRSAELSKWKDAKILDTLAAACAETGDFARALTYERKAIALEEADSTRKRLQQHLHDFQMSKPVRDLGLRE